MCGRYLFLDGKNQGLNQLVEKAHKAMGDAAFEKISLYEVFPGQRAFVIWIDPTEKKMCLAPMLWGYPSKNGKLIINARSETANASAFFSSSKRAVIACSGYYEWSKSPRRKYYFHAKEQTCYLGAFARKENDGMHFVILTEEASLPEAEIHNRQPLLFHRTDALSWCRGESYEALCAKSIPHRLMEAA